MSGNKVILFSLLALLYFGKIVYTKKREGMKKAKNRHEFFRI